MNIQLSFDTEKDNLEDLKKVCAILQEVINRKEKKLPISELDICNAKYKEDKPIQVMNKPRTEQPKKEMKTQGGCRFIPYEDMSDTMANIFQKKKRI